MAADDLVMGRRKNVTGYVNQHRAHWHFISGKGFSGFL
jgi:hypothetical protein